VQESDGGGESKPEADGKCQGKGKGEQPVK
jgi:hypothetical protein